MISWGRKKHPETAPSEEIENKKVDDTETSLSSEAQHSSTISSGINRNSSSDPSTSIEFLGDSQEMRGTKQMKHDADNKEQEKAHSSPPPACDSPASPSLESATNWPDALYLACRSQSTFMQTPKQVLHHQEQILRPRQDECTLFQSTVETTAKAVVDQIKKESSSNASQTTLTRRALNVVSGTASTVAWGVSKIYQYSVADADDYEDTELDWKEERDDTIHESTPLVPWDQPVVCVKLVEECTSQLILQCSQLNAVSLQGTSGKYTFAEWAVNACPNIARGLQRHDLDLLAHILVQSGHALMAENNKYLVFGDSSKPTNTEYAVSLLKLNQAIYAAEQQISKWQDQETQCARRALERKQRNDVRGAKLELTRKRQLDSNISTTQTSLLNLLQVRDTLELSHLQQSHVTESLKQATSALAALRQECTVEDVDEVMLDLKEESDHVYSVSTALVGNTDQQDLDEDELMQELERLQLDDDDDKGAMVEDVNEHDKDADTIIGLQSLPSVNSSGKENQDETKQEQKEAKDEKREEHPLAPAS